MNYCNNERIYRYAETLLNAAELSVLLGQDGSAYLQQVRDRAHCHDTGVSREDIIQERHKEFVGEGKRWLRPSSRRRTTSTVRTTGPRTRSTGPSRRVRSTRIRTSCRTTINTGQP